MFVYKWIKSFFAHDERNADVESEYNFDTYSLLEEPSLTIKDAQNIQKIIENYGNLFNTENPNNDIIQNAYDDLISISYLDENIKLYLHDLMLFSSIRMKKHYFM